MTFLRLFLLALFFVGQAKADIAPENLVIPAGEVDIPVTRYGAPGRVLILWFPSEYGVLAQEHAAARHLAEKGLETWLADLYGARFLPTVQSSAEILPAEDVYHVIRAARAKKPQVWLLASGRGAKYALEGARLWQQREGRRKPLSGALLLYPNLYAGQPEPGEDPVYLSIARETKLDVHILQGELSPWYWTLDTLKAQLEAGGSRVRVKTYPGIRDRFYFRESATPAERALGERLPEEISEIIRPSTRRSRP